MTTSMSAILADVSAIVTAGVTWMGQFVTFITDNPIVLIFVIVPFVGLGIGLIKRLLSL